MDKKENPKSRDLLAVDPILPGSMREKLARLSDKIRLLRRARWPARRQVRRRRVDDYLSAARTEESSEPDLT